MGTTPITATAVPVQLDAGLATRLVPAVIAGERPATPREFVRVLLDRVGHPICLYMDQ